MNINAGRTVFAKSALAIAISLSSISLAQATSIAYDGTIWARTSPTAGTTIDYYLINLPQDTYLSVDIRANESYTGTAFQTFPNGFSPYFDVNGDGEFTLLDSQYRIFKLPAPISAGAEVANGDDMGAYPTAGWSDGSINSRDSYGYHGLEAGDYVLAFSNYSLTTAEAVNGFNTDTLNLASALTTGEDHADYRITFSSSDPFTVQPVPVPAAVWFLGSAMAGLGFMRRKQAVA